MSDKQPPDFSQNSRSDDRMITRAVLRRWQIPEEYKEAVIQRLMTIACNPNASPRDATRAAQAIIAAEKQNQEDEPNKVPLVHVSFAIDSAIERELARLAGSREGSILAPIAADADAEVCDTAAEASEPLPDAPDAKADGIPLAN